MLEAVADAKARLEEVLGATGQADAYWNALRAFLAGEVRS